MSIRDYGATPEAGYDEQMSKDEEINEREEDRQTKGEE